MLRGFTLSMRSNSAIQFHHILISLSTQGEELSPVRGKAEQFGVRDIYIDDLREEFVRDFVFPMFRYHPFLLFLLMLC